MDKSVAVSTADLLPTPSTTEHGHTGSTADTEKIFTELLANITGVEQVSADSHFFDDLGADSMVMARFCARVRKRADLPAVSMKDIYRYPTIRSLTTGLATEAPSSVESWPAASAKLATPRNAPRPSTPRYVMCGALQLLTYLAYIYLAAIVFQRGYDWISGGSGLVDIYLRSALFGAATFFLVCTLPILAKWLLVGRWKPQEIPIWSLAYVRFWIVKTLVRSNPLVLFAGSPLFVLYLRALGAKIGRGVTIFSPHVPVCADLLTIGEGTVIRKDSYFTCYRGLAGMIQTGSVTLGRDVFIGEITVLDIETSMGDGAQLGHSSSLQAGQAVPAGECWHGSPAQRAKVDYRVSSPVRCGTMRRALYGVAQLLSALVLYVPLALGGTMMLLVVVPQLSSLLAPGPLAFTSWTFYRDALFASFGLFFGVVLVGLVVVFTVPRILNLFLKPDKTYRLYGFHYGALRAIARLTNIKFFSTHLFGDSSYIVHYLRCLGYDLSRVVQTGSNFGTEVRQDNPYQCFVGSGTMVADGLSVINADFSSTSFRVSRASIGARNFLGNQIAYPWQSRTGDNCLLATKVMVPVDGAVRTDVGLLGSPSFEIPRSVERDSKFDHLRTGDELRRGLAAKNKHNLASMAWYLLVRWIYVFGLAAFGLAAMDLFDAWGASAVALSEVLMLLFTVVYFVLVERAVTGFRSLRPIFCSIYQPGFWLVERLWKVPALAYVRVFDGTPFKGVIWRLLGARIGSRVFDDGCMVIDRTLVTIGSDCMLNAGSHLQPHSQEDGTFKADRVTLGAGCTVGIGALVHYGVTVGDGAVLAPDSFLMKGEEVPGQAWWGGNPARELHGQRPTDGLVGQAGRLSGSKPI